MRMIEQISRLLRLFIKHLLTKVQGDAVAEYMKVFKSIMKFFGKCILIKEGKEDPCTVLTLISELLGWIRDYLSDVFFNGFIDQQNVTAQTLFSLTIARVFDVLSNSELTHWFVLMCRLGNNTEADDLLASIGTSMLSLIKDQQNMIIKNH